MSKTPLPGRKSTDTLERGRAALRAIRLFYANGDRDSFAASLQQLRKELDLKQKEFAEIYGIDLSTLRNWEQKRTVPDLTAQSYLNAIAEKPEVIAEAILNAKRKRFLPEEQS